MEFQRVTGKIFRIGRGRKTEQKIELSTDLKRGVSAGWAF